MSHVNDKEGTATEQVFGSKGVFISRFSSLTNAVITFSYCDSISNCFFIRGTQLSIISHYHPGSSNLTRGSVLMETAALGPISAPTPSIKKQGEQRAESEQINANATIRNEQMGPPGSRWLL